MQWTPPGGRWTQRRSIHAACPQRRWTIICKFCICEHSHQALGRRCQREQRRASWSERLWSWHCHGHLRGIPGKKGRSHTPMNIRPSRQLTTCLIDIEPWDWTWKCWKNERNKQGFTRSSGKWNDEKQHKNDGHEGEPFHGLQMAFFSFSVKQRDKAMGPLPQACWWQSLLLTNTFPPYRQGAVCDDRNEDGQPVKW